MRKVNWSGKRRRAFTYRDIKRQRLIKLYIILAAIIVGGIGIYCFLDAKLGPVMQGVAEVRAKEIVSGAVNDAIIEYMDENSQEAFLQVDTDDKGYISMVSANTTYMNEFSAGISKIIHDNLKELEGEKISIPLGSILGSNILTQIGPSVSLKLGTIGSASVKLYTELESGGINQTKYKVYMDVTGKSKPIMPFVDEEIDVSTTVLVAETVIVGQIPQTYLTLPGGK